MPDTVIGQPAKFERLTHVESLMWYDGELLGHYTLDGDDWLCAWLNMKDLGLHYHAKHIYYRISKEDFKKYNANEMTLRETMERTEEMWVEESKWEKLPNGHGVPNTCTTTWQAISWAQIPEDERPTTESFLHHKE